MTTTFSDTIFVFGSNLAGRHGKGAALFASQKYLAERGVGVGRTGLAYAIPTKDRGLNVLSLNQIHEHVKVFLRYAALHPNLHFIVSRIGCGLAGYTDEQIAPMFRECPENCELPLYWPRKNLP